MRIAAMSESRPTPLDFPDSPLAQAVKQPLMLGLFLPTQTGGFSQSTYPRDTDWSFEYNARLTLAAEANGFDFVFSLQQWVQKGGFGGEAHYRENFLDPFITTATCTLSIWRALPPPRTTSRRGVLGSTSSPVMTRKSR